jgi:hypothetical protein
MIASMAVFALEQNVNASESKAGVSGAVASLLPQLSSGASATAAVTLRERSRRLHDVRSLTVKSEMESATATLARQDSSWKRRSWGEGQHDAAVNGVRAKGSAAADV